MERELVAPLRRCLSTLRELALGATFLARGARLVVTTPRLFLLGLLPAMVSAALYAMNTANSLPRTSFTWMSLEIDAFSRERSALKLEELTDERDGVALLLG